MILMRPTAPHCYPLGTLFHIPVSHLFLLDASGRNHHYDFYHHRLVFFGFELHVQVWLFSLNIKFLRVRDTFLKFIKIRLAEPPHISLLLLFLLERFKLPSATLRQGPSRQGQKGGAVSGTEAVGESPFLSTPGGRIVLCLEVQTPGAPCSF